MSETPAKTGNQKSGSRTSGGQKSGSRRINWLNVNTVLSAAILIGAEVFGAAYAGGWAIAMLLGLGDLGVISLRVLLFVFGIAVMISFIRQAQRVEPFTSRR